VSDGNGCECKRWEKRVKLVESRATLAAELLEGRRDDLLEGGRLRAENRRLVGELTILRERLDKVMRREAAYREKLAALEGAIEGAHRNGSANGSGTMEVGEAE
jgi:hypothetical protein